MRPVDNPFSVTRQHAIEYRFPENDNWEKFWSRLESFSWRGAIVGKKGNGKTTLLLELEEKLSKQDFSTQKLFLNQEKRKFTSEEAKIIKNLNSKQIVLFDGAEQLNFWRWQHFLWKTRKVKGLIITAHKPSRLPTILQAETTLNQLKEIVNKLTVNCSESRKLIENIDLEKILRQHDGNHRLVLRELYDKLS